MIYDSVQPGACTGLARYGARGTTVTLGGTILNIGEPVEI